MVSPQVQCTRHGYCLKVLTTRFFVVNFKGDWKYLYQLFCMERYASKEEAWISSRACRSKPPCSRPGRDHQVPLYMYQLVPIWVHTMGSKIGEPCVNRVNPGRFVGNAKRRRAPMMQTGVTAMCAKQLRGERPCSQKIRGLPTLCLH